MSTRPLQPLSANDLAAKLSRLDELEQQFAEAVEHAKLEAMKELAYGAGHEINNPLANISARAQTLLSEETHPEKRRKLAAIHAQALRAHEMITDLMLFARPPAPRLEAVELRQLAQEEISRLAEEGVSRQVTLKLLPSPLAMTVSADPTQMRVMLRALLMNALEAFGPVVAGTAEKSRRIDVSLVQHSPLLVELRVTDNGPGISAEQRSKVFDPFYSGREAGRGLGFGLCKCWRIVQMHGGEIRVKSEPGQGTTFIVRLPATL
ncbi:MAG: HAMP domain-containing sensor histidine kinase [Planctomycetota bacterium]|nr:HAMP domain-containing sensor histidine kinase [Planctomycetota bacterium]